MRARTHHPLFFVLALLLITLALLVYANPDELTVSTDKASYRLGNSVSVYGSLTLGGSPVTNGLVAVQVEDSKSNVVLIRTVPTGTLPPPWKVKFVKFFACDSMGNPVSSFKRGSFSYFKATVQNIDTVLDRPVTLTIDVMDSMSVSIGVAYIQITVVHGQNMTYMTGIRIPDDANVGSALAYANVYTEWPEYDGYPYCPEVQVAFTIASTTASTGASSSTSTSNVQTIAATPGSYNAGFRLSNNARAGYYKIYARARYNAAANTGIEVIWRNTDVNRDSKVNIIDVTITAKAFTSRAIPGDIRWVAAADQNGDGLINIIDVVAVARDFGKSQF